MQESFFLDLRTLHGYRPAATRDVYGTTAHNYIGNMTLICSECVPKRLYSSDVRGENSNTTTRYPESACTIESHSDPQFVVIKLPPKGGSNSEIVLSIDFIEWFRGFADAESSFGFNPVKKKVVTVTVTHLNFRLDYTLMIWLF